MNSENIKLEEITLVGISIRTNNERAQSQGDIAKLWEEFFAKNIISKVENKISDEIYCVYTNYESNFTGDYTTFLGCAVSKAHNESSDNLETLIISADNYRKFISEGELPNCVLQTWQHIWVTEYPRAYKADFDIYGVEAQNPTNAKVTTYLSIIKHIF